MEKSFNVGGDINPKSEVYVSRMADKKAIEEINNMEGSTKAISVLGERQSGKSSFRNKLEIHLKDNGWKIVHLDFRGIRVSDKKIDAQLVDFVNTEIVPKISSLDNMDVDKPISSEISLIAQRMAKLDGNWVVFADEIDNLAASATAALAFAELIKKSTAFAKENAVDNKIVWVTTGLLRMSEMVGSESIKIGKYSDYSLEPFSPDPETIAELKLGFKEVDQTSSLIESIICKTITNLGGQPFLVCLVLSELANLEQEFWNGQLDAITSGDPSSKTQVFLSYIAEALEKDAVTGLSALDAYKRLREGTDFEDQFDKSIPTDLIDQIAHLLIRSGLCVKSSNSKLRIRSIAHTNYCGLKWINRTRAKLYQAASQQNRLRFYESVRTDIDLPEVVIINAGGTLGMEFHEGKVVPPDEVTGLPWYSDIGQAESLAKVSLSNVFQPTDGANINPPQWFQLVDKIHNLMNSKIAGVVVMHGTDTMAYSASYAAFALGSGIKFPVIFTGSQAPHVVEFGDAKVNLLRALKAVVDLKLQIKEVCICFGDEVYRATRAEKQDDFRFNGFFSPSYNPLAVIGEKVKITLTADPIKSRGSAVVGQYNNVYAERILKISLYPGMLTSMWLPMVEANPAPQGIILESLGIGNVSLAPLYTMEPLLTRAQELNIPVLISSRYPIQGEFVDQYDAASLPIQKGAVRASNMTPAAALTKFFWSVGLAERDIERGDIMEDEKIRRVSALMETNIAGELEEET